MTISTLDQAIAGMQTPRFIAKAITATTVAGRLQSLWPLAGSPGAGAYDNTLAGVALTGPINGQIPRTNPVSGNAYLARFQAGNTNAGTLVLCDRLWHNGGFTITSTSAQTVNSVAWPARDAAGSSDGDGVLLGCEVSAATGAGTPTISYSYTNQAGTAGRSGTNSVATTASATIGGFYPLGLQAGDTGVRSVQSLTLSATWTSGTINLVAYRVIAALELPGGAFTNAIDLVTGGMPRIFDGSVPFLMFLPQAANTNIVSGCYVETHG